MTLSIAERDRRDRIREATLAQRAADRQRKGRGVNKQAAEAQRIFMEELNYPDFVRRQTAAHAEALTAAGITFEDHPCPRR